MFVGGRDGCGVRLFIGSDIKFFFVCESAFAVVLVSFYVLIGGDE